MSIADRKVANAAKSEQTAQAEVEGRARRLFFEAEKAKRDFYSAAARRAFY
jgi:hypothetical protein